MAERPYQRAGPGNLPPAGSLALQLRASFDCRDEAGQGLADLFRRLASVRLTDIGPRNHCLDRHRAGERGCPACPGSSVARLRKVPPGDVHHVGPELIHLVAELWLPGGMPEKEPKAGRVSGCSLHERLQAGRCVPSFAGGGHQPGTGSVEHSAIQVGLRLEVPVEDDPADSRFSGNIVQAGGGEPRSGESLGGGSENLLASLGTTQPSPGYPECLFAGRLAAGLRRCHVRYIVHSSLFMIVCT